VHVVRSFLCRLLFKLLTHRDYSIHDPALAAAERTSPSTVIEEVEQAPTQDEPAPVQPTVTISHVQQQVQHEATPMRVSTPSVRAPRPRLPPVSPPKAREPHPAWRVVGGGITMANLRTEDQMDEDAVEQELLGAPAAEQQPASPVVEAPQPVQPHSGYPAYAVPQHPVYAAYAYPSPGPVSPPQPMYTSPAYPTTPVQQYPGSPVQQFPMQPQAFAAPADVNGWSGWTQPQPFYAPMPMYGHPSVVYAPPPHFQQPFLEQQQQQQQPMSQYQAPTPVLYGQSSTALTYGLPRDANTVSALADGGVDVSRLGFEYSGESAQDEFDAFEGYGVQTHEAAFGSHEDEEMETEMEMDIRMGVIGQGMISSAPAPAPSALTINTRPAPLAAKWSWADEVEEADPQWTTVESGADSHGCATTPNSPRMRGRLFSAESP